MMEKVSVVMATYNTNRSFLKEAIYSILNQTYENIELVIVCDGSKEEYEYITNEYKSPKIRVLLNEENKGLPYSLNRAIESSTGQYIARMDSDDISFTERIETQMNYLKKNNLDLCGTNAVLFGIEKGIKRILWNAPDEVKGQLMFRATLIHPTVLGKRSVFNEFKYNERFLCSQDFELWGRVIEHYNIGICPKPLLKYRIHGSQASIAKQEMQKQNSQAIIHANVERYYKNDQRIFQCLWLLSGREAITKNNLKQLDALIDYMIYNNNDQLIETKVLSKVLINRFFELSKTE